jgi:branched-chain amino acid transport system substrate-binding protein
MPSRSPRTGPRRLAAGLILLAVLLAACAPAPAGPPPETLVIVSSLPLTGSSHGLMQTLVNAIRLKLEQENHRACDGRFALEYRSLDDSNPAAGKWDVAQELKNVEAAVSDPAVVAYIGTYDAATAQAALPLLNQAGLVMISPANTLPSLTKPGYGEPDEPGRYYPTGVRNFVRLVVPDDVTARTAAEWARTLGVDSVYIVQEPDPAGVALANLFHEEAERFGLRVLGHELIEPKRPDQQPLAGRIQAAAPELVYFAGTTQSSPGQLLRDLRAAGPGELLFMGPLGIQNNALIEVAGVDAVEGVYATAPGVPFAELGARGQAWYRAYKQRYNSEPEGLTIFGYQAAEIAVHAINQVCAADRARIRDAVAGVRDFDGVLGRWSFDQAGDISLQAMTHYQVRSGAWVAVEPWERPQLP